MNRSWLLLFILIGIYSGCRTPFDPEVPETELRILVVEGYLDTEGMKSELKLSRTVPLSTEASKLPENGATVLLRGQNGQQFPLSEKGQGVYLLPFLKKGKVYTSSRGT